MKLICLQEVGEGRSNRRIMTHEAPIIAGKTQESAEFGGCRRRGPVKNGTNFVVINGNTSGRDDMTQIMHLGFSKHALGSSGIVLVGSKGVEDGAEMKKMLFPCWTVHQDIVKKNEDKLAKAV